MVHCVRDYFASFSLLTYKLIAITISYSTSTLNMDLMIMFCLLAGVGVVSVSADNFLITNQAVSLQIGGLVYVFTIV